MTSGSGLHNTQTGGTPAETNADDKADASDAKSISSKGESGRNSTGLAKFLVSFVTQTALIVGVLAYFGYVRADTTLSYFGIDPQLVGLSPTDFLLGSPESIFAPAVVLSLGVMLTSFMFVSVVAGFRGMRSPGGPKTAAGLQLFAAAVIFVIIAVGSVPLRSIIDPATYLILVAAALLVPTIATVNRAGLSPPIVGSIIILVVALGFAAIQREAKEVGLADARSLEASVANLPDVTIYSEKRLAISSTDGANVNAVTEAESKYGFATVGLKLLFSTKDLYFLVKSKPPHPNQAVILIAPGDDIRVDIRGVARG